MKGLIAKKLGMTSVFDVKGVQVPCTVLYAEPCVVTQMKTKEVDGYTAIQLSAGDIKEKNTTKSQKGHFAKASTTVKRHLKEFRDYSLDKKLGDVITCEIFTEGEEVTLEGYSKGKGFQGVVKRHGFTGVGEASHGQHDRQRAPGSVGGSSFPSRVFKGMRMAGRKGNEKNTVKGLKVVKIFPDKNYILVKGAVPGYNGSVVYITSKNI